MRGIGLQDCIQQSTESLISIQIQHLKLRWTASHRQHSLKEWGCWIFQSVGLEKICYHISLGWCPRPRKWSVYPLLLKLSHFRVLLMLSYWKLITSSWPSIGSSLALFLYPRPGLQSYASSFFWYIFSTYEATGRCQLHGNTCDLHWYCIVLREHICRAPSKGLLIVMLACLYVMNSGCMNDYRIYTPISLVTVNRQEREKGIYILSSHAGPVGCP